jgi:hypothetical protein
MRWLALAVVLLVPLHLARADDGGAAADASVDGGVDLPDASAGEGSAQSGSEEGDTPVVCQGNADCDNGSACRNHVCVYQAPRNATNEGCSTAGLWLLPSLAVLALRRPYFLSKRTK